MSKVKTEDFPIFFIIVWIPMMFLLMTMNTSDPDSLLTDEQKLEKQKENADLKEVKDKEWEEGVNSVTNPIQYFIDERPFPFNLLLAIPIGYLLMKGVNGRGFYRGEMFENFANPRLMIPVMIAIFYLIWVSGEWGRIF